MSRQPTTAAFIATIAVAVPAGWHLIEADLQTDGRLVRPLQATAKIGDATVTVEVDHGIVKPGARVKATLVATSARPHPVTVDMHVMVDGTVGPEERVSPPLEAIDHERFVLPAGPAGGRIETYVTLGHKIQSKGSESTYRIYIGPPKAELPRNSASVNPDDESVAGVGILAWSGNELPMQIDAPASVEAGKPFTITLRVRNTTKRTLQAAWFQLGSEVTLRGIDSPDEVKIDETDNAADDRTIPPGGEDVRKYTVTAAHAGPPITMIARGYAQDTEGTDPRDRWTAGAMDVKRIAVAPATVAAK